MKFKTVVIALSILWTVNLWGKSIPVSNAEEIKKASNSL